MEVRNAPVQLRIDLLWAELWVQGQSTVHNVCWQLADLLCLAPDSHMEHMCEALVQICKEKGKCDRLNRGVGPKDSRSS